MNQIKAPGWTVTIGPLVIKTKARQAWEDSLLDAALQAQMQKETNRDHPTG